MARADERDQNSLKENESVESNAETIILKSEPTTESLDKEYGIYREEQPENPCDRGRDTLFYEKRWYDQTQIYINSKFCEPALWFDNFFASDRIFEEGVAGTYIRWRNDYTYDEEEHFKFKTRLKASVSLPGLEKRLRLTFDGDEDEDLRDIAPGDSDETRNSLGLQFDFLQNARSKFNVSISLSPRIRFRYRYTLPLTETITLRLTQEVQKEESFASTRTRFDFEKLFYERFLFRSSTEGKFSEEYDGVDWLQAFILFQRLDRRTSLSYEASAKGITEPFSEVIDYRIALRFRKNFHRRWLFYEISPEMTWPITFDEGRLFIEQERRSKWRLFFRLEVHFGNAQKKKYTDYN
ncbi:MAG: hypothetical protein COA54_14070 [Thiotrichaceae bacterium]|nr:MAG: hypothetical protein COA54_14070 [Thiotrichaceae bacterium]